MREVLNKIIETTGEMAENDKTLIIFTLLIYGVVSMILNLEGSVSLIEKLSSGLLGMAIGRSLK